MIIILTDVFTVAIYHVLLSETIKVQQAYMSVYTCNVLILKGFEKETISILLSRITERHQSGNTLTEHLIALQNDAYYLFNFISTVVR